MLCNAIAKLAPKVKMGQTHKLGGNGKLICNIFRMGNWFKQMSYPNPKNPLLLKYQEYIWNQSQTLSSALSGSFIKVVSLVVYCGDMVIGALVVSLVISFYHWIILILSY